MFGVGKKRYESKGIQERLDVIYRILLWDKLDILSEDMELDYLQVFQFSVDVDNNNQKIQRIVHTQEKPKYSQEYIIPVKELSVEGKVYVIEDNDTCTMLWAEEY